MKAEPEMARLSARTDEQILVVALAARAVLDGCAELKALHTAVSVVTSTEITAEDPLTLGRMVDMWQRYEWIRSIGTDTPIVGTMGAMTTQTKACRMGSPSHRNPAHPTRRNPNSNQQPQPAQPQPSALPNRLHSHARALETVSSLLVAATSCCSCWPVSGRSTSSHGTTTSRWHGSVQPAYPPRCSSPDGQPIRCRSHVERPCKCTNCSPNTCTPGSTGKKRST